MESHELLRLVFKPTGHKNVAAHLGLSDGIIHKWSRPHKNGGTGTINPLDRLRQIWDCTQDTRLAQWVCELAGGFFVPNPRVNGRKPPQLLDEEHDVFAVAGETIEVIARASRDRKITAAEAKAIRRQWEHEKSVKEHFVLCCEERDFAALAKALAAQGRGGIYDLRNTNDDLKKLTAGLTADAR